MTEKCDLNKFFNEFNIKVTRKSYGVKSFNNFYDVDNYKKHLTLLTDRFKHDILCNLPLIEQGNKAVYLRYIYSLLIQRKKKLIMYLTKSFVSNSQKTVKHIIMSPLLLELK